MWLGEAPISLMLETSLVHPHTIVSMLINDLADIDNEVFLFLDDCLFATAGFGKRYRDRDRADLSALSAENGRLP